MFQDIGEYIETNSDIKPSDQFSQEEWKNGVEQLFDGIDDAHVIAIKDIYLETIPSFYKAATVRKNEKDLHMRKKRLIELETTPQIEQRSDEWYKHAQEYLTASQFGDLLAAKRTRGKLVLSKVASNNTEEQQQQQSRRYACWTQEMNPFDWGIRFEPVAKMIYEELTKTKVRDIGRLVHSNAEFKLAASPDGIIEEDNSDAHIRLGNLVEFKAPISRQIEIGVIPKQYWAQMQIQMEVANVDICDYFEIVLRSPTRSSSIPTIEGPVQYSGYVYTVGKYQPPYEDPQPFRYIFSKLNEDLSNSIPLEEGETILETTPWGLLGYNLVSVLRSTSWFESMKPLLSEFWNDVALAKEGKFVLVESRRKNTNTCLIQDENNSGEKIIIETVKQQTTHKQQQKQQQDTNIEILLINP